MLIDLSTPISPATTQDVKGNDIRNSFGHLGTHFDVMDKVFPLEFTTRRGIVFDVSHLGEGETSSGDVDLSLVEPDMFVAFHTGFIERENYGTKLYFTEHPQLTDELIDLLLEKRISILAVDCAGIRRGALHAPKDQFCADHGVFVVENVCNLAQVLRGNMASTFTAHTYPIHFTGITGLPCRVVAELAD